MLVVNLVEKLERDSTHTKNDDFESIAKGKKRGKEMEKKKKGFFPQKKFTMLFLACILALDIIMFIPAVCRSTTSFGTATQYIFVNVILFLAPTLALVDGAIKTAQEKKTKK